ncbi:hypothetical protein CTEN210_08778 [Chaetoceros tenuissimus]|uniref:UDP-galactose transporter n=1 Tax=Chaetoceros tenuissimus TaxID=426638 RepID=A0AAD3CU62_9STRA|nr:hypothetical protein CTEN210_08778 [Chaetoceros tenuissimus]
MQPRAIPRTNSIESQVDNLTKNTMSTETTKTNNVRLIKLGVLCILCLQNSCFTVLRRYSQGVLKENYSKHEVLLFGEVVKMIFSAYVISTQKRNDSSSFTKHMTKLTFTAQKMYALSLIYGLMNILSYVALRNVSAGIFTICAQLKILTTASFSTLMLNRRYSLTKWRALFTLIIGVLLFSEPIWNTSESLASNKDGNVLLGSAAVLTEVTLSGFASIYFEKVIKTDTSQQLNIWERNFQLALGSFPVYLAFMIADGGGEAGLGGGWSMVTFALGILGAAGGLLVALSIKYGDAILKTLATTGAIILSSVLDHMFLSGPLDTKMVLSGCIVITSIFNYSFDATPQSQSIPPHSSNSLTSKKEDDNEVSSEDEESQSLLANLSKDDK